MLTTGTPANDPTTVPYETTEEARMLLCVDGDELAEVRRSVGEAAYYLSDTLEPDERATLLADAEAHLEPRQCQASKDSAADALILLCDATGEVEEILRGPSASSELHIALRALRHATSDLADYVGVATNNLDPGKLGGRWPDPLRRHRSTG
jgi:hypothetical protein